MIQVTRDEAVVVRAAYAGNIARLAKTAMQYLDQCHPKMQVADNGGGAPPSYESELQTLHEMIQHAVALLLTDPCNVVKQTLMENGITELCVFFGKQKGVCIVSYITFVHMSMLHNDHCCLRK